MTNQSLKSRTFHGMIWSAIETFILQGAQVVITIVLARILSPGDYGLIGMLSIFMALSQVFIDSGMGNALIQKQDRTEMDFSTVFVFNLGISSIIYLILFLSAPLIAEFFKAPQLTLLTRVLTLSFVINSFSLVQSVRLTIKLDFKTKAKANSIAVILSGTIAILAAKYGFGVWALVVQAISRSIISVALLWYLSRWKPNIQFSRKTFNELIGFGSKLLSAGIIATIFHNLYNVVIGRSFSAKQLGYYTQAMNIAELTSGSITGILQQVTFPILASLQDDKERMLTVYRKLIGMTTFFVFPVMVLLSLLAKPLILLFLTDKWESTIVLLQWLCFARIVRPVSALNMNILNAIGRSDLFLKVDLSKIPIAIIALIITIPLGVKAIVIGHVITSFIAFFINAYLPGKFFGYGAFQQIKDMARVVLSVGLMAISVSLTTIFLETNVQKLFLGGLVGIVIYASAVTILKVKEIKEVTNLFVGLKNKNSYQL